MFPNLSGRVSGGPLTEKEIRETIARRQKGKTPAEAAKAERRVLQGMADQLGVSLEELGGIWHSYAAIDGVLKSMEAGTPSTAN